MLCCVAVLYGWNDVVCTYGMMAPGAWIASWYATIIAEEIVMRTCAEHVMCGPS